MKAANVFDLEQQIRRVIRKLLVVSDLERKRARSGDEVALVRNRFAVDLHRQHLKLSAMKRSPDDFFEELSDTIAAGKRAAVFTFPTALFQLQKAFDPRFEIVCACELAISDRPLFFQLSRSSSNVLSMIAANGGAQI